ncbi:synaptotagmin-like protein 2 isoform X7 [Pristis pectinata]|uniref:synaptotagmin-like protein 2 isoform X7 n=1 Tax=Pristis pectinata TaxID=685728 RepID=UPI00223E3670|nr:synaptotagmin-like protein 2 isoform X7 [Pristis pectinata]
MKRVMANNLDLSFLTEDEYQAVLKVIQRDSELKQKDSERIRTVQKSIQDEKRRKLVTGQWFDEVKAKRYRNALLGVDLIKASIREEKPIKHETTEKTEQQQVHQAQSCPHPTLPQAAKYETTSVATDEATEEPPDEVEKDKAKRQIKPKSTFGQEIQRTSQNGSWESGSDDSSTVRVAPETLGKGRQRDFTGPNVSTSISESTSDWQNQTKSMSIQHPQTYQTPRCSDKSTHLQSNVSRIPRRINSVGTSGDLCRTGEPASSNANILEQAHLSGQHRTPAVSRIESPTGGRVLDQTKQDNVAVLRHQDTTEAHLSTEIREPTPASVDCSTQVPRAQNRLEFTEEPWKAPEKSEHSNVNGQGLFTVTTVASPVQENVLDMQKPKKTVTVHYKGAPTYQIPANGDKKKTVSSSITHIPKWKNRSKESEAVSAEKLEDVASEPVGSQELPAAIANEDQQTHQPLERLNLSPTSRIPRLKNALETTGENSNAPVEDLKQSSKELPGPTYGLSPVMRALARARKSNAKSMDNLSSTLDRETITSLVNENETRGDGSDQSSTDDKPPVIKTPVLEHARVKELSKSVPMLISESESDSASEISFNIGWHRKTPSDASHSSDMASVSSVSGSIMSVYSADFGSIDAQGSVQFALDYNEKNKEFQIYVSQCKDLAVVDEKKGRTDAYVKTYLLPDKARMGKRKTSVKKRNTNPLYNEILKYKIEKSVLLIQKLNLSVWHNDTLGRNSFLGEVDLDLASWDWSNRELNWYLLKSRIPAVGVGVDHRGEINLAIKYIPLGSLGTGDPPTGEVHIWMKNARDLPQLRSSGVDSFVKCYVLPDTSKKSYQKTRIVKKDINPIYNHTIVYDGFRTEDLKEVCVELTVWDHEKLTNHFLGGLRLGLGTGYSYGIPVEWMDSTEEEAVLWQEMMSNPNEWIPGSLALRSRLGGKKFK